MRCNYNHSSSAARLAKFGELKIEDKIKISLNSLRENFIIPTRAIVANLTTKQANALLSAVDLEYYKIPRLARFEDISKKLGVPRTTYEEHVRKAESKIINSVSPYLSVYFGRSGKKT